MDDSLESIAPLSSLLTEAGALVTITLDGLSARKMIMEGHFDLVILDWTMPNLNGGDFLSFTDTTFYLEKKARKVIPYVTYSGTAEHHLDAPETVFFKRIDHWQKPISISQLQNAIQRTLTKLEEFYGIK